MFFQAQLEVDGTDPLRYVVNLVGFEACPWVPNAPFIFPCPLKQRRPRN